MGRDVSFLDNRPRDGYWYAYYTSNETALNGKPGVDARRAENILGPWSDALPCRTRGFLESPFVLFHSGRYYIFQPCVVWSSTEPLNFDSTFLSILTDEKGAQRAAIEVVVDDDGQHYITGYGGPGGGIWVAQLNWRSPSNPKH